jgi:hypothetical protein
MELCKGKTMFEALGISPINIIDTLHDLPFGNYHCAILAVTTLYKAISNFLLQD